MSPPGLAWTSLSAQSDKWCLCRVPCAQRSIKKGLCKVLIPEVGQEEGGFRGPWVVITAKQITTNPQPGLASPRDRDGSSGVQRD